VANLTKTVDGVALPRTEFAYVGDPEKIDTWHLPMDAKHIEAAVRLFGHEQHVPADKKTAVARVIAARAKKAGIDVANFEKKYCGLEHADFSGGWVEIFRAGDYGGKGVYSVEDLDRVIANYDPAFHEAPAVVGHPKDNAPAYGWADRLMRRGDVLLAKFREVDPAFEQAVKAGRYKKRSAAFYLGEDGKVSGLRHVGWLGAQPPEVKGLKNLNFDDAGQEFMELEFGEEEQVESPQVDKKTIREALTEFFSELVGKKDSARNFSEGDVDAFVGKAVEKATAGLKTQIEQLKVEAARQSQEFSEREKKLTGAELKGAAAAAISRLKEKGSWVPAFEQLGGVALFEELAAQTATVEFGEADKDGKRPKVAMLDAMVSFLEGVGRIVPDGRRVQGSARASGRSDSDPLTAATRELMKKNKDLTFTEAMIQAAAENPELETPVQSAAGAV
jgi:hypothetical protein